VSEVEIEKKYKLILNEDEFYTILNCLREFTIGQSEFLNLPLNRKKAKTLIEKLIDRK